MGLFDFFRLKTAWRDLGDRVQALESGQKALELEWESTYDSLRRLASKIARRSQRDAEIAESASTPQPGVAGADPAAPGLQIDPMSARIRAARRSS